MRCFPVHSISQRRASLMDGSRWTLINFFHVVSVSLSPDFGDLSNAWLLFSLDAVHIIRSVTLSWIVQGFKDGVISFWVSSPILDYVSSTVFFSTAVPFKMSKICPLSLSESPRWGAACSELPSVVGPWLWGTSHMYDLGPILFF